MKSDNDVLETLQQLSDELNGAQKGLFGKKPDIPLCCDLCNKLLKTLEPSLAEAGDILRRRNEILTNADVAAKNTVRKAEEEAEKISNESALAKRAESDAQKIIENAYAQCDNLILRTKSHLDKLFQETEQFLLSTLSVVRTNREELRSALTDGKN